MIKIILINKLEKHNSPWVQQTINNETIVIVSLNARNTNKNTT